MVLRPALSSISPSLMNISPGIMRASSSYRFVHGDKLGSIRECRFHLHVVDHLGNAVHHLCAGDDVGAGFHQLGDGAAIARTFQDEVGDERDRLWMVELDAALEPAPRY